MYKKFEKTSLAWYIVSYPPITILFRLLTLSSVIEENYVIFLILTSAMLDFGLMLVIGALLYLIQEYTGS